MSHLNYHILSTHTLYMRDMRQYTAPYVSYSEIEIENAPGTRISGADDISRRRTMHSG